MADIQYSDDAHDPDFHNIRIYRKALSLYHTDVFDKCATVLREIIKTDPPIFWKCTFLTMLCVVTEHWHRAERYRLHAEALWKLLDESRAFYRITETRMNNLRAELTDTFRWCWEGRPDDPKADAEGAEDYWEEWGGKDPEVDFDTTAVGIGPDGITVPRVSSLSEDLFGASIHSQVDSNATITLGEATNFGLDHSPSHTGHARSTSDPTPSYVGLRCNKRSLDDDDDAEEEDIKRVKQETASVEQPSQNTNIVTRGPSSDDKLHLVLDDDSGEAGSRTTDLSIRAARRIAPRSTRQIASGGTQ
jgi:hypothetical protein